MTRRTLIGALGALPILAQTSPVPPPAAESVVKNYGGASDPQRTAPMLCVLSSNMSKVPWEQLGDIARQMGFDGVDLTCYPGGHVEPAIIAVDLVRAFEVVRGAGINVPIVTTKVTNLAEPNAFGIIALSGNSGVPVYRTGLWKYGQNVSPMLRMQEMGIISGVEAVGLTATYKSITQGKFVKALLSNGKALIVENEDSSKTLQLEVYLLTEVGTQILGLGTFEPDLEYLRLVGKQIASQGFTVQLCDWRQISETEGQYFNAVRIDA